MDRRALGACCVALMVVGPGCVVRTRRVAVVTPGVSVTYVEHEPPPPRVEPVPPPPAMDQVWVGGFWRWDGRGYAWVPGHFVMRPRPRAVWVAGHWDRHPRGWFWVEGQWR